MFQMGEVAVPRVLFATILKRIERFGVPPPLVQRGWYGDRTRDWRLGGAEADAAQRVGIGRSEIGPMERANTRDSRRQRPFPLGSSTSFG